MSAYEMGMLACMMAVAAKGHAAEPVVSIYLNDPQVVPNVTFNRAQTTATGIFEEIGIRLRFHRESEARSGAVSIVMKFDGPVHEDCHPGALAYAAPFGTSGTRIHVMYTRVAAYGPQSTGTLLGHVMAHEIAHVLQGVNWHSGVGVMRSHWTGGDIQSMGYKPLSFGPEDIESIYAGLAKIADVSGSIVGAIDVR